MNTATNFAILIELAINMQYKSRTRKSLLKDGGAKLTWEGMART